MGGLNYIFKNPSLLLRAIAGSKSQAPPTANGPFYTHANIKGLVIFGGHLRIYPEKFTWNFREIHITGLQRRISSWDRRTQRGYCRKSSKKETAELKESDRKARNELCSKKLLAEKIMVCSSHQRGPHGLNSGAKVQKTAAAFRWFFWTSFLLAYQLLAKVKLYQAAPWSFEHILSFHCVSTRLKGENLVLCKT